MSTIFSLAVWPDTMETFEGATLKCAAMALTIASLAFPSTGWALTATV